jgi:methylated-DNA-protein-cysteine methyltransferase related protein
MPGLLEQAKEKYTMTDDISPTNGQVASLKAQVFALVRVCPAGKVTTYGWIGKALGYPRGARMIGWFMNEADEDVPAQRVINSKGELSGSWAFGQKGRMRKLLEAEGVTFSADERVDLKRYGWDPSRDLSDEERQHILEEASTQSTAVSSRLLQLLRLDPASPLKTSPSGE